MVEKKVRFRTKKKCPDQKIWVRILGQKILGPKNLLSKENSVLEKKSGCQKL